MSGAAHAACALCAAVCTVYNHYLTIAATNGPGATCDGTLVRHKYASTHTVTILSTWQQDDLWGNRWGATLSLLLEMALPTPRYASAHMDIGLLFLDGVGVVDAGRLTQHRLISYLIICV